MDEFVKELLEELEKESDFFSGTPMGTLQKTYYCKGVEKSIEIVKKLMKKYENEN